MPSSGSAVTRMACTRDPNMNAMARAPLSHKFSSGPGSVTWTPRGRAGQQPWGSNNMMTI